MDDRVVDYLELEGMLIKLSGEINRLCTAVEVLDCRLSEHIEENNSTYQRVREIAENMEELLYLKHGARLESCFLDYGDDKAFDDDYDPSSDYTD